MREGVIVRPTDDLGLPSIRADVYASCVSVEVGIFMASEIDLMTLRWNLIRKGLDLPSFLEEIRQLKPALRSRRPRTCFTIGKGLELFNEGSRPS